MQINSQSAADTNIHHPVTATLNQRMHVEADVISDDVIFNVAGALIGYVLLMLGQTMARSGRATAHVNKR